MDKTLQKFIGAVQIRIREQQQGLGDFPKTDQFEHGTQVGVYRGLQESLHVLERVIEDEANEEARR